MLERGRLLKQRLRAGEVAYGAWLSLTDPVAAEAMASAGFDFVMIDCEHAPIGLESLQVMLMAFKGEKSVPIVRVPWNDQVLIKQILDLGAEGILIPNVKSADETRAAVAACHYPPKGIRGFGPRRAARFGQETDAYMQMIEESLIVIPQIEDVKAAAEIEAILDVPGVDALCIGPNDLSGSAGVLRQHDHPVVADAIDRVLKAANARGVAVCPGVVVAPDKAKALALRGMRLMLCTADLDLIANGARAALARTRGAVEGS